MKAFANYAPINIKPGGGGSRQTKGCDCNSCIFFCVSHVNTCGL